MTIRVGIMSNAHVHAALYIQALRSRPEVELVGLADHDQARAAEAHRLFGVPLFDGYAELLGAGLDGVIITSENTLHREHIQLAAAAGITTILCEKPLATTVEDAEAIEETCRIHDIQLMVSFPMRFSEPIRAARELITSGGLGTIVGLEGVNQGKIPGDRRAWFIEPDLVGGGALTDHTVHVFDAVRWLLEDEAVEVYAQANTIVGEIDERLETSGLVVATFAEGAVATIDCSWNRPMSYPAWGGLGIRVIGTAGVIDIDAYAERMSFYDDRTGRYSWIDCGPSAYDALLGHFVRCVEGSARVFPTLQDGVEAVRAVAAAYESERSGRAVRLAR